MAQPATKLVQLFAENTEPERRSAKRSNFYRGELPDAVIEFAGKQHYADVYDLSPNGIAVLPRETIAGLDTVSQTFKIRIGNSKMREATLQNISHIKFSGALRLKLGLQTNDIKESLHFSEQSYDCGSNMPLAYCDDPIAFNRTLLFNVLSFRKSGLLLRANVKDVTVFPGMRMELKLMMPARGEFSAKVEVSHLVQDESSFEVSCDWVDASLNLQSSISEFLLMTVPNLSMEELRSKGFLVAELEKAFLFRCASSPEEMDQILGLRLKTAQKEGRWVGETDINKLRDNWDKHARQIYCEINGRIVAAGRIVFNNGLRERSEHVSYNVDIPEWLWDAGFVEGSRVCTDPDFRGADMFFHIIQHMSKIVTQSGHRYLVLNCVDSLVPVYRKTIGVQSLKRRFHTEYMKERALNLLCVDFRAMQVGINFSASSWLVNSAVGSHLINRGQIRLRWWENLLRGVFQILHRTYWSLNQRKKMKKAAQRSKNVNKR